MRIIFDYQIFGLQKYGGISRYFVGLIKGLNNKSIDNKVIVKFSNNGYVNNLKRVRFTKYQEISLFSRSNNFVLFKIGLYSRFIQKYVFNFFNKIYCLNELKGKNNYIFHPTYYDPYFLKVIGNNPFVLTVYDMVHENFPQNITSGFPIVEWKKRLVEKAAVIIAISNNTKKELVEKLEVDPKKIKVIHLYQTLKYKNILDKNIELPSKYLLFMGERSGYKNFNGFLEVFNKMANKYDDLFLVCGGSSPFNVEEVLKIKQFKLTNKVMYVKVGPDRESVELYSRALMFVYPSLCEGFGIPLLEAFECRTPVACSNTSCFPEVVGDAALLFDPNSSVDIAEKIEKLYLDENLRQSLINRGIKRSKMFSMEKTVSQTIEVYKSLQNE